jgi:hypothetical protein
MISKKSWWRGVGLLAGTAALLVTGMAGAYSAPGGTPGPPDGAGGGGGNKPPTEVGNNLSVPVVLVGTGAPALNFPCGTVVTPDAPTLNQTPIPFPDYFGDLALDGVPAGNYYLQREHKWQAGCATAESGDLTATGAWGDNLAGGEAKLKVGSPVRVEVGLTVGTAPAGLDTTGFPTVKLTNQLDRDASYGTASLGADSDEIRVWASGSNLEITGPTAVTVEPMAAEINATGKVVYGYNWRPSKEGVYTLTFTASSVGVTTSVDAQVLASAGGGGGGGGHGGGGGGGGGPRR